MTIKSSLVLSLVLLSSAFISGCQTTINNDTVISENNLGEKVTNWRKEESLNTINSVYIMPATLEEKFEKILSKDEKILLLHEIDKQICFEMSRKYIISKAPNNKDAIIKTNIINVAITNQIGSGASAIGKFFIPVPVLEFRVPGTLGGLAIESEFLTSENNKIAFMNWERNAKIIVTEAPSLSRIGDALQLAKPMANALGNAYSTKYQKIIKIDKPDPCEEYGTRSKITGNKVLGIASGLYIPEKKENKSQ